jgi:aspartokinase-like uncharacterized kinase
MEQHQFVAKVGGSLYDWPDLGPRLRAWLDALRPVEALLVPGGGPTADVIRALDCYHALGEEAAHWLALHALSLNGRFLQSLLPGITIVDAFDFARQDEGRPDALPHTWDVTSDSIAARVAEVTGARRLVLLKSADFPEGIDVHKASRRGLVDAYFTRAHGNVEVYALNIRAWEPGSAALAGATRLMLSCPNAPGSLK